MTVKPEDLTDAARGTQRLLEQVNASDPRVRPATAALVDGRYVVTGVAYGYEPMWEPDARIRIEMHRRTVGTRWRWSVEIDGQTRFYERTLRLARIEASCFAINARRAAINARKINARKEKP